MAKQIRSRQRKKERTEPSIGRGSSPATGGPDDIATAATIERLEAIAGGADEDDPRLLDRNLGREFDELQATTEEEIDALEINLVQDGVSRSDDSSGRVIDDAAEEEIARFTEVGPTQANQGAVSVEPGRDDTSRILRKHQPRVAGTQSVVEGNLDEPRDEEVTER